MREWGREGGVGGEGIMRRAREHNWRRFKGSCDVVRRGARPGDVVLDAASSLIYSPSPLRPIYTSRKKEW